MSTTERTAPSTKTLGGDDDSSRRSNPLSSLFARRSAWIVLALAVIVALFGILAPAAFLSGDNVRNIATNASVLLVLAVGMTYVISTAGIDLSVGSVLVFSSVVSAKTMATIGTDNWANTAVGLVVALVAGAAWGILNGFLIARTKLPALIVTLATMGMALGAARLIANGIDIIGIPRTLVNAVGVGRFAGIPVLVIIAGLVAVVGGIVLHRTRFGMRTFAVGSNEQAVHRSGINVERHLIRIYLISGLCAGLAGFLTLSRFATTTLNGHSLDNMNAIAAVVLGGTSLFGGYGSMPGTVVGVFIPVVLSSGFVIMGLPPFWQEIAIGAVLIAAVLLDRYQRANRDL